MEMIHSRPPRQSDAPNPNERNSEEYARKAIVKHIEKTGREIALYRPTMTVIFVMLPISADKPPIKAGKTITPTAA
jgi:hypothetical protein